MLRRWLRRLFAPPDAPRAAAPSPATTSAGPPGPPSPDEPHALVLYTSASCPYCLRVKAAARGLGLTLPERDVFFDPGAHEALVAGTGGTQVPALFIDGRPMLESADIIAWLTDYARGGALAASGDAP